MVLKVTLVQDGWGREIVRDETRVEERRPIRRPLPQSTGERW